MAVLATAHHHNNQATSKQPTKVRMDKNSDFSFVQYGPRVSRANRSPNCRPFGATATWRTYKASAGAAGIDNLPRPAHANLPSRLNLAPSQPRNPQLPPYRQRWAKPNRLLLSRLRLLPRRRAPLLLLLRLPHRRALLLPLPLLLLRLRALLTPLRRRARTPHRLPRTTRGCRSTRRHARRS